MAQAGTSGTSGTSGVNGTSGTSGIDGTNGTGFTWTGTYNLFGTYNINDVVEYNGSSYVNISGNNAGGFPDINPTDWSLMAQAGTSGTSGISANIDIFSGGTLVLSGASALDFSGATITSTGTTAQITIAGSASLFKAGTGTDAIVANYLDAADASGNYSFVGGEGTTQSANASSIVWGRNLNAGAGGEPGKAMFGSSNYGSGGGNNLTFGSGSGNSGYYSIVGGESVFNQSNSVAVFGRSNQFNAGGRGAVMGNENIVNDGTGAFIFANKSQQNTNGVYDSYNGIFGGESHNINDSINSVSVGGKFNNISGTTSSPPSSYAIHNGIFAGSGNTINSSRTSVILGGRQNRLTNGQNSAIVGGLNNSCIFDKAEIFIGGGSSSNISGDYSANVGGNAVNNSGIKSFIGAGENITLEGNRSASIGGFNTTNTGGSSVVLAGEQLDITTGDYHLLHGNNSSITGTRNTIGLGVSGRTLNRDFTTYTEGLHYFRSITTDIVVYGAAGSVVIDYDRGGIANFTLGATGTTIEMINLRNGGQYQFELSWGSSGASYTIGSIVCKSETGTILNKFVTNPGGFPSPTYGSIALFTLYRRGTGIYWVYDGELVSF